MKPVIADRKPKKVTVAAGKDYYWCACGRSKNQPFCDGSHTGTSFSPKKFSPPESGDAYLCMCKRTHTPPYCDGTHQSLETQTDTTSAQGPASPVERHVQLIEELAQHGLANVGHHGEVGAMGVPGPELPRWDDLQIVTAQMARKPLQDDAPVSTGLVLGPNAAKPLELAIPCSSPT